MLIVKEQEMTVSSSGAVGAVAGLFHGMIACSGSALSPWAVTSHKLDRAIELGQVLGIEKTDPAELVAALKRESTARIVNAKVRLTDVSGWNGGSPTHPILTLRTSY